MDPNTKRYITIRENCPTCGRSAPEFKCDKCNKRFRHKHNFIKHINIKRSCETTKCEYPDACPTCDRVFPEFICDKCKFAYKYECHLKIHFNRSIPCVKQPKRYFCECGSELGSYPMLYIHKKKSCKLRKNQLNK